VARRLNLDGDGQGDLLGHGGEQRAVMVYQLESYRYWQAFLGESGYVHGQFGENFTVDGLPDNEVCIGDQFRIGGAIFEVTQPRVTCYRLGIRMNRVEMPALLVSHHRPGFYMRVLQEGEVGAGDEIVKVAAGPQQVTIAEVDSLLYLPGHPRDRLERALRVPALSPGWKASLQTLLGAAGSGGQTGNFGLTQSMASALSWRGFRPLQINSISVETEDVRSFTLGAVDGLRLPDALPGQHVVVKLHPEGSSASLTRNYSLSGSPGAGVYRISVKREVGGAASGYLHEHAGVGDTLAVSAPRGSFTLVSGPGTVVLVSGGIGVTPLLAMLQALVATDKQCPRDVWWIHGARDGRHHAFAEEALRLLASLRVGRSYVVYSQARDSDELGRSYDGQGRVDLSLLQRLGVPQGADFYICGPTGLNEALGSALKLWGVAEGRVHTEVFGAGKAFSPGVVDGEHKSPHAPEGKAGAGPNVVFTRSNLVVPWNERFASLLELAEACAVPVRWSCRVGVCHNCECALVDGNVRYAPEPLDAPADGNVLICCATPVTEIQLDL
jgi:ferredoxin-NADP reductase/MOSC domain-containing protein YiiM/ferredoxin